MKRKLKINLILLLTLGLVLTWGGHLVTTKTHPQLTTKTQALYRSTSTSPQTQATAVPSRQPTQQSLTVNWHQPSQSRAYPSFAQHPNAYFDVSIANQRVYVRDAAHHDRVLYMMYCTTGKNDRTPHGTYAIEAERGLHFYNAAEQEGANYYVSWHNRGEYLFHSVPVDQNGHYITSIANQLGQRPVSHGCIQLTIPDAKWVYDNVPYGMKVVVH